MGAGLSGVGRWCQPIVPKLQNVESRHTGALRLTGVTRHKGHGSCVRLTGNGPVHDLVVRQGQPNVTREIEHDLYDDRTSYVRRLMHRIME
jgi:hypothetical protein